MTSSDKRGSPRHKPKAGTHIVYIEGFATIRDLSLNGMYALDPDPLPEGTKIRFSLRVGTDDIPLQGFVSRTVAEQGMVIQFTNITPEAKRHLKIYLADLASSSTEPKKS